MVAAFQRSGLTLIDEVSGKYVACSFCRKFYGNKLYHVPLATKGCQNKAMLKRKRAHRSFLKSSEVVGCPMCCGCECCKKRIGESADEESNFNLSGVQD